MLNTLAPLHNPPLMPQREGTTNIPILTQPKQESPTNTGKRIIIFNQIWYKYIPFCIVLVVFHEMWGFPSKPIVIATFPQR